MFQFLKLIFLNSFGILSLLYSSLLLFWFNAWVFGYLDFKYWYLLYEISLFFGIFFNWASYILFPKSENDWLLVIEFMGFISLKLLINCGFDCLLNFLFDKRKKFPEDEPLEGGNLVFFSNGLDIISFWMFLFNPIFSLESLLVNNSSFGLFVYFFRPFISKSLSLLLKL